MAGSVKTVYARVGPVEGGRKTKGCKMKALATSIVLAAVLVYAGSVCEAAVIGVNFKDFNNNVGEEIAPGTSAGVVPQANWNNAQSGAQKPANGSITDLKDSGGNVTTADLAWTSPNTWRHGFAMTNGNEQLMHGYIDSGDPDQGQPVVTVTDLPYAVFDVYVYFDGDGTNNRRGSYTIDDVGYTYYMQDPGNFSGVYTQVTNTTDGTYESGNYCVFEDVARDQDGGFVLRGQSIAGGGNPPRAPINGIQITPEPASLSLLLLGGLAFVLRRRK